MKPAPDGRLRGAYPHLLCGSALPLLVVRSRRTLVEVPLDVSAPVVVPTRSTSITLAPPRPEDKSPSTAPTVPAIAAAPQPALIPKTAPIHLAGAPAEDHPAPPAPLTPVSDPDRPTPAAETTFSSSALPSAADTPGPQVRPLAKDRAQHSPLGPRSCPLLPPRLYYCRNRSARKRDRANPPLRRSSLRQVSVRLRRRSSRS